MSTDRQRTVSDTLRKMHDKAGGVLMPRNVWQESKPVKHPLHPEFEWNDSTAADLYRDEQARALIRSVRFVSEEQTDTPTPDVTPRVYAHHPLRGGYSSLDTLREQPEVARMVIAEAFANARGQLERMRELAVELRMENDYTALMVHLREFFNSARRRAA
ncbi:hypothetical protein AB4Y45_25525 [Paraburkholderia sp. EG287A]|uniref:hypothetical protein n=1 Tax=unclassified Paraburkholderia TaxID=2615204 RepID=UPI0034D1CC89